MSMTSSSQALAQSHAATFQSGRVLAFLKRWWIAYTEWRLYHLAAAQLRNMSDRELRDIGLDRSQIEAALRGDLARDQTLVRYY